MLRRYVDQRGDVDVVATVEPTYYPSRANAGPDVLDVFLCRDLRHEFEVTVADDLSSDHVPVLATLAACPAMGAFPPGASVMTDWGLFAKTLEGRLRPPLLISTCHVLDLQVTELHGALADVMTAATRPAPPPEEYPILFACTHP